MSNPLGTGNSFDRRHFLEVAAAMGSGWLLNRSARAQGLGAFYNCVQVEPWYADAMANPNDDEKANLPKRASSLKNAVENIIKEANLAKVPVGSVLQAKGAAPSPLESVSSGVGETARRYLESVEKSLGKGDASEILEDARAGQPREDLPRLEAVFAREKRWRRSTVNVQFLHSSQRLQNAVREAARQWGSHCCIDFRETQNVGDIRVSFDQSIGHCSLVGVDSANGTIGGRFRASFNINPGDVASRPDSYLLSIALHEFGHAIGLQHEHQNPNGNFQWNQSAVIATLSDQGWSNQMIQQNVFTRITDRVANEITRFDPDSIMIYPWLRGTVIGPDQPPTDWNPGISPTDESTVRKMYGCAPSETPDPKRKDPAEKIVVQTDPRKKLDPKKARTLEINTITSIEFQWNHEFALYKFTAPRKDSTKSGTDEFIFETVDGSLTGKERSRSVPVVVEYFSDSADFSESKKIDDSTLGVSPSDDDLGSIGVEDAYLRHQIVAESIAYLLIRPLRRFKKGDAVARCRLLARRVGIERPNGLDERTFGKLLRKKK